MNNKQSAGWQHMTINVEGHKSFTEEYYAVSQSSVCDTQDSEGVNCDKLTRTHSNGVEFFFSCITGLIWSLLALCIVSFHGSHKKLRKSSITKVFSFCICIGFIPVILIIIFQIDFSGDSAFCGMNDIFDELIENKLNIIISSSSYYNCDYKNSEIVNGFPVSWMPGFIMILLLLLLCLYKPLSPFFRRVLNTCSCCVNRKVSDSVIHVPRYFSFSGSIRTTPKAQQARFKGPPRKFSGSLN